MDKSQRRALRFQWQAQHNGKTPKDMLTKWLGINYGPYFRAQNRAEVAENFRLGLLAAGFHGCTIDEILAQITRLIRNDPILQWLKPGRNGQSRMEILVNWLGEHYVAYSRAKQMKTKYMMLAAVATQISGAGLLGCKPRDVRLQIKHLEDHLSSPYLCKFKGTLSAIFMPGLRRTGTWTTKPVCKNLSAKSSTACKQPKSRATRRKKSTTQVHGVQGAPTCGAPENASTVEPPIKTEPGFPDGSVHAPFVVYDDADDAHLMPSTDPPIDEIYRLEALFDARLKFSGKKTLTQAEIDLYFPKPRK